MSSSIAIGLTAWGLISIPLGVLLGRMFREATRDHSISSAHSEPVISKKQSRARSSWRVSRAALRQHQSSVPAGD
ncbi:hypothetical protein YH62_25595 [Rhizobium sp. LC145]|nr:hypothetical protein YH62_25595 [Rhizobium sp. LC145]